MPDRPLLDRAQLARIAQNVPQTIAGLEKIVANVAGMPSTIEEANALAGSALTVAQGAMSLVVLMAEALERMETAPAQAPQVDADETAPRTHLGTISSQDADQVEITGGTVGLDAGSAPLPSLYFGDRPSGLYRSALDVVAITIAGTQRAYFDNNTLGVWGSITASQQVIANAPAGTPPLAVVSTTRVANLNVDRAGFADSAGNLGTATTYPANATDLTTVIALANALKAANIAKGV